MKYLSLLLCAVMFGCMDNGVKVADGPRSATGGKITFGLSKAALPQDIASLTFTLTNLSTSETVSKTLVVSTDTLMQVSFEQLEVGAWHVKVVAKDSLDGQKYAGESDANVIEGQTTQLSLTLNTLTIGVGTLVITVNWPGTALFVDFSGNPVLSTTGAWYDTHGVANSFVLADSGKYKMFFMNYGKSYGLAYGTIGLAESVDGTTWTRVCDTVMTPTQGAWDQQVVSPQTVIAENGMYTMFYTGTIGVSIGYNIGSAISQDGIHWTKRANTVLPGVQNIAGGYVVKANNQYYMYYHTAPSASIHLATSTDGVNWQVYSGNPVLTASNTWEGSAIVYGSVIFENNTFTMLYANTAYSQSFGLATSTDGIHWIKDSRNPVFSKANIKNSLVSSIAYPFLARVGNELRLYYTGTLFDGTDCIGYAVKR